MLKVMSHQQLGEQEVRKSLIAGSIHLDLAEQRLWLDDEVVTLRQKPFLLLQELMSHPGELLTKDALIHAGWEGRVVTDGVLTTAMKELRKALGDRPRQPRVIETVHGRGYRFLLPVTVQTGDSQYRDGADTASSVHPPVAAHSARKPWLLALLALVSLLLAIFALWRPWTSVAGLHTTENSGVRAAPASNSIALLPLDDFSPGGARRWFADGLSEEILNVLAQVPGLQVASRTSSFRFRDTDTDIREIGRELGVAYVLEGSVRTNRDAIRVTVQLIGTDSGIHVFSRSWNRPLAPEHVFAIQSDIAREVLVAIDSELSPLPELPGLPEGTGQAAYEAFLHGRELLERRAPEYLPEAVRQLREAVAAAPRYAPARAALGEALIIAGQFNAGDLATAVQEAAGLVEEALRQQPDNAQVLRAASLLRLTQGRREEALTMVDQGLAVSPGLAELHFRRATVLSVLRRYEDARDSFMAAYLLNPLSVNTMAAVAQVHYYEGNTEAALALADKNLRWNPEHPIALQMMGRINLGIGDYLAAAEQLHATLERSPEQYFGHFFQGYLFWQLGMDSELLAQERNDITAISRAAALLATGKPAAARAETADVPDRMMPDLNALAIAFWSRAESSDLTLADAYADALGLLNPDSDAELLYPGTIYKVALIWEASERPEVQVLWDRLQRQFAGWQPSEAPLTAHHTLAATALYLRQGRQDEALALLERAQRQGLVLRQLQFDPAFDEVRENPRFSSVVHAMQERAGVLRRNLRASPG